MQEVRKVREETLPEEVLDVDSENEEDYEMEEIVVDPQVRYFHRLCRFVNSVACSSHRQDEAALAMFFSNDAPQRRTLADIIMEKIREKEMMEQLGQSPQNVVESRLDPKVVKVYRG
jgi:hypothetical protein